MLVVFAGLPGTGKTTIARAVAARRGAAYLRIDGIEQALRDGGAAVGALGYAVAQAVAAANLVLGVTVVADCVNPVAESRAGWRAVADGAGVTLLDVECVCSDEAEHRRRVEARVADIAGLVPPTWADVLGRGYAAWGSPRLVVDTARCSATEAVALVERGLDEAATRRPPTPA